MHFTGKERDSESNLDNFSARYDSSQYGRFMTSDQGNAGADPANPQSWNMYAYVLNNPINFIDPYGLCSRSDGSFGSGNDPNSGNSSEVSACDLESDPSLSPVAKGTEPAGRCGFACNLGGILSFLGSGTGNGNEQDDMFAFEWDAAQAGSGGGKACPAGPANVMNFIHAHQDDVDAMQEQSGISADYLLGLSGWESTWGANRFAQKGNNFFSLHGGSNAPFANGSMKASRPPYASMSTFSSYFNSGQSFIAQYGSGLAQAASPKKFAL